MSERGSKQRSYRGVLKILRFNWPWYAAGIFAFSGGAALLYLRLLPGILQPLAMVALALGGFWLLSSILVSHLVYDRSGLAEGSWLDGLVASDIDRAAAFHAGQDEASEGLALRLPAARRSTFDIFDPKQEATDSLRRARAAAASAQAAIPADPGALPLKNGEADLACLVFAAHEIRDPDDRITFFLELHRILRRGGRLIVVEQLRDGWNALAFGPNVLHFLSRNSWMGTFTGSGFRLLREERRTPFVRIFHLEPAP